MRAGFSDPNKRRRDLANAVIAGAAITLGLYVASRYNYLLFHSLAEIFSVVIAFGIFTFAWNARGYTHVPQDLSFLKPCLDVPEGQQTIGRHFSACTTPACLCPQGRQTDQKCQFLGDGSRASARNCATRSPTATLNSSSSPA